MSNLSDFSIFFLSFALGEITLAECRRFWYINYGYAGIAQLVERNLAKVEVAGPSPVSRSKHICIGLAPLL
jgi:hypothetical protein